MNNAWSINRISTRILLPALAGLMLYLAMLMVFGNLGDLSESFFIQEALFLVVLACLSHEWTVFLMGRKISRSALSSPGTLPKLIYFSAMLASTAVLCTGITLAYFAFILDYYHFGTELVTINLLLLLFQSLVHLYYIGIQNIRQFHELLMEKEDLQGRQLEMELESFKSEMNTGWLMDCLENLLILVHSDIQESDRYIQALAHQYRYLLDSRQQEFSDLGAELKVAGELVYLLNQGTQAGLIFEHTEPDSQQNIVPGTLLNIIHTVGNSMMQSPFFPLHLKLLTDGEGNLRLRHENRPKLIRNTSLSMEKLNRSYRHYTGKEISRREEGDWMEWFIPGLPEIVNEKSRS